MKQNCSTGGTSHSPSRSYQAMRELIRAVNHPTRAAILAQLIVKPMTIAELACSIDSSPSRVRYNTERLSKLGIIEFDTSGPVKRCRLGGAVSKLSGPTVNVVTITARDGSSISFPPSSLLEDHPDK